MRTPSISSERVVVGKWWVGGVVMVVGVVGVVMGREEFVGEEAVVGETKVGEGFFVVVSGESFLVFRDGLRRGEEEINIFVLFCFVLF